MLGHKISDIFIYLLLLELFLYGIQILKRESGGKRKAKDCKVTEVKKCEKYSRSVMYADTRQGRKGNSYSVNVRIEYYFWSCFFNLCFRQGVTQTF